MFTAITYRIRLEFTGEVNELGWIFDYAEAKAQWDKVKSDLDMVANRNVTMQRWQQYFPIVKQFGFDAAFAVQDGMDPADVPPDAAVVFVGGSTVWKWRTLRMWCESFKRVHVGRVNSYRRLCQCHDAGAESCDGTGWFRGDHGSGKPLRALMAYLAESSGERSRLEQMELPRALQLQQEIAS